MKVIKKSICSLVLMIVIIFSGCGEVSQVNTKSNKDTSLQKIVNQEEINKDTENISTSKKINKEGNNASNKQVEKNKGKENIKKDNEEQENKITEYIKEDSKIKQNNKDSEKIKTKEIIKDKQNDENVKGEEIAEVQQNNVKTALEASSNKELKVKDNKEIFTIIISKNAKGYTENPEQIISSKKIEIKDNTNFMTYLKDKFDVLEKGGFIYEIEGIHNVYPIPKSQLTEKQKKNKIMGIDWFVYLNGEKCNTGANDLYVKKGDIVRVDYHQWDKREFQSK
ncbi:hypothetical protein OW763_00575 [Clostridium aestuarii]|uniref:Transcobalamin-like C-terminal domain-containing protein n=1 Tax=Clostridium aestuarii TaxID=338193 RepID=A0ABT4CVK8_9CLOT|nr:DUF4430 domain-containing protein [Clostridium aestuarii]MCY6482847.1 hypothetical protein [Clostridium aestuarii]